LDAVTYVHRLYNVTFVPGTGTEKRYEFLCYTTNNLFSEVPFDSGIYEGWNFNSGNYLFTTDTK